MADLSNPDEETLSYNPAARLPGYLIAADNHNLASGGYSMTDMVKGTVGTVVGAVGGAIVGTAAIPIPVVGTVAGGIAGGFLGMETALSDGKFAAASLLSGANSFYNTGIDISNWFSDKQDERRDTDAYVSSYDSDLGAYYRDHKAAADMGGFVVGSLIPTTIGLKAYNAGTRALMAAKNGEIGANFTSATGLLGPTQARLMQAATAEMGAQDTAFTITNSKVLAAFAVGAAEEAIQGGVASIAILSTMKASPILDSMDAKDMAWNVMEGALFGGVLGGVIRGGMLTGEVKSGVRKLEIAARDKFFGEGNYDGESFANKIIFNEDARRAFTKPSEVNADGTPNTNFAYENRKFDEAVRKWTDDSRILATELTKGDSVLGVALSDRIAMLNSAEESAQRMLGVTEVNRISVHTAAERLMAKVAKRNGPPTQEEFDAIAKYKTSYHELWGENAGNISTDGPTTIGLTDRLSKKQSIEIHANGVRVTNGTPEQQIKLTTDPKTRWDPLDHTELENEARNMWALHEDGPTMTPGMVIHDSDFALLSRAYLSKEDRFIVRRADGSDVLIADKEAMKQEVINSKEAFITRAATAHELETKFQDPFQLEQRLKTLLGAHFKMSSPGDVDYVPGAYGWTFRGDSTKVNQINLSTAYVKELPLWRWAQVVKHEQGHNQWNAASSILPGVNPNSITDPALYQEVMAISKKMRPGQWKGDNLKGYSEADKVHEMMADTFAYYGLHPSKLDTSTPFGKLLGNFVQPVSKEAEAVLFGKASKLTNAQIAKMADVKLKKLEGDPDAVNPINDYMAMQSAAEDHTQRMIDAGRWNENKGIIPVYLQPRYAKVTTDITPVKDIDGNLLSGMAAVKQQQRLTQIALNNATASVVGPQFYSRMSDFDSRDMFNASKSGGTQTLLTGANSNYGQIGSIFQQIGKVTADLIKAFRQSTQDYLTPHLFALKQDQEAALQFEALQTIARKTSEKYVYDAETAELVLRRVKAVEDANAAGQTIKDVKITDPNTPERIPVPIKIREMVEAHIARNGERVENLRTLSTVNGAPSTLDPNTFYPIPVNLRDYPHFAFVTDDKIVGSGHVSMIYAATPQELDNLITKVRAMPEKLTVLTKGEAERYHKAMGDYSRDETITENVINTALQRAGVSSNFVPKTDSKLIADSILAWHLEKDSQLARFAITTKYSKEFNELRNLGESATNLATSKVGAASLAKYIEGKVKNPFVDYIKTALDVSSTEATPLWSSINSYADRKFSQAWSTVRDLWTSAAGQKSAVSIADEVNRVFADMGVKTAYYDAAMLAHANHVAPQGALQTFVSRANALLSTTLLRMDPMNAFNNVVGSNVLTGAEFQSVLKGIRAKDPDLVGKLAYIKLPGTGDEILSPTKMYANAVKDYFQNPEAVRWAEINGFTTRHLAEHQMILDDLALTGKESVKDLDGKLAAAYARMMKIGDWAEGATGNKMAESFNRFISSNIMKQITDVAVSQGAMDEKMALSYINTFVNRTQGNYMASQRPLMFQGALGSAMGLFQTYQFNMAQQLLRHVAEGNTKTAALAMGLQSTIYGLHGLPGFDAINANIIGNMSGNKNHRDLYDATYTVAGKEGGDWLMYGMASNVFGLIDPNLKSNVYSRGDINPRSVTVVPLDPSKIPIVSASTKLFSSMKDGMQNIANGGAAWTSMLQAIEHAGINRPLAGLAQVLEATDNPSGRSFSTSTKGNVIASNDLMSLANLTRIAGAKPLDEAVALDAGYRLDAYKQKDVARTKELGEAIKSTVIGGKEVSQDQVTHFANEYVKLGGKQDNFNKFFIDAMKNANTSQANKIVEHLKSPQSQAMQQIMGSYQLKDFQNTPQ